MNWVRGEGVSDPVFPDAAAVTDDLCWSQINWDAGTSLSFEASIALY